MEGKEGWEGRKKGKRKRRGERMLLPCDTNFDEFVVTTLVALFND